MQARFLNKSNPRLRNRNWEQQMQNFRIKTNLLRDFRLFHPVISKNRSCSYNRSRNCNENENHSMALKKKTKAADKIKLILGAKYLQKIESRFQPYFQEQKLRIK